MTLAIKDSMILIHLAKTGLLEESCEYFGNVKIPKLVFKEVVIAGKRRGFGDSFLVEELILKGRIKVKEVREKRFIEAANRFNILKGEAEALALYWQEKADFLATDDDNVRSKKDVICVKLIGTPAIMIALRKKGIIDTEKAKRALQKLGKIGWFNSEVIDKALSEVERI